MYESEQETCIQWGIEVRFHGVYQRCLLLHCGASGFLYTLPSIAINKYKKYITL